MIKKEKTIIPARDEMEIEKDILYCDKCGEKIYEWDCFTSVRSFDDSEVYKERKYKYYDGYDFCDSCVHDFLIPLLKKELNKNPNNYEDVYTYDCD